MNKNNNLRKDTISLIERQIEQEDQCLEDNINKNRQDYEKNYKRNGLNNTVAVNKLTVKLIKDYTKILDDIKNSTNKKKSSITDNKLIKETKSEVIIYFLINNIFKHIVNNNNRVTKIIENTHKDIVNNANYKHYKKTDKVYYDLIQSHKKTSNAAYRYATVDRLMRRNKNYSRKYEYGVYEDYKVILKLCMYFLKTNNVFKIIYEKNILKKNRIIPKIILNLSIKKSIYELNESVLINADAYPLPMLSKPLKWEYKKETDEYIRGGFYSNYYSYNILKKVKNEKILESNYKNQTVLNGLNILQNVEYKINNYIFNVFNEMWKNGNGGECGLTRKNGEEIPAIPWGIMTKKEFKEFKEKSEENKKMVNEYRSRVAKIHEYNNRLEQKTISFSILHNISNKFKDEKGIFFCYNLDFRGRLYTLQSFLSPQGIEISKALLDFKKGEKIEDGLDNLKIHTANMFGKDKLELEERIEWFNENEKNILNCVENWENNTFWKEADEPFSFLRGCKEYYDYKKSGLGKDFITTLICHIDGKCNGTQHMAAMLLDKKASKSVCIIGDKNNDLYTEVLKVVKSDIKEKIDKNDFIDDKEKQVYFELYEKIERKFVKRNVMTTAYSVTRIGMKQQILEELKKIDDELGVDNHYFKSGNWFIAETLSNLNYNAIRKVLKSTIEVQQYLKNSVSILIKYCKNNSIQLNGITWKTKNGFEVFQECKKSESKIIDTYLNKIRIFNRINYNTQENNLSRHKSSIAANFVHSYDACHLINTVNKCEEFGITNLATIHDSYGTTCNNIEEMKVILKNEFVKIYNDNVLDKFRNDLLNNVPIQYRNKLDKLLPHINRYNDYNINDILNSKYFFS